MSTTEQRNTSTSWISRETQGSIKSFFAGGFGGMCLVLVGHPFDLAKVRMQTAAPGTFKSTFHCLSSTFAEGGVKALYRGMSTPLVGVTPLFAVCFWGYDLGLILSRGMWKSVGWADELKDDSGKSVDPPFTLSQISFAGGFSALPATLLMTPTERVKVLLQTQKVVAGEKPKYSGPGDVIRQLYREGGIRSIYRGTGATLLRDVPGSVAYFAAYEVAKAALTPKDSKELNVAAVLTAGGLAGVANWAVAIPPDVLKSRLQSAPEGTYKGTGDVLRHLLATEGPTALFRGLGAAMVRAVPANAACFFGRDVATRALDAAWPPVQ